MLSSGYSAFKIIIITMTSIYGVNTYLSADTLLFYFTLLIATFCLQLFSSTNYATTLEFPLGHLVQQLQLLEARALASSDRFCFSFSWSYLQLCYESTMSMNSPKNRVKIIYTCWTVEEGSLGAQHCEGSATLWNNSLAVNEDLPHSGGTFRSISINISY
jgi:hypothetical protein